MNTEPEPSGDLVPPGPAFGEQPAARKTGALSVDEWLEENRRHPQPPTSWENPYGRFYASTAHRPPPSQAMSGWALGLSLVFCVPLASLAGAGLAVAVLVRSRDGRDHGKRKAIAALVISALVLLAYVAYVVVLVIVGLDETERDTEGRIVEGGSVAVDRLQVGDCFSEPARDDPPDDGSDGVAPAVADVVPCDERHQTEVFHEFVVEGEDFPGRAAIEARLADCLPAFRAYVGTSYRRSELGAVSYYPTPTTWRLGDHKVTCSLTAPDLGTLDASMRGSRR